MRIHVAKFEPSCTRGSFSVPAPAGAVAILARMSRMGEGEILFSVPDASVAAAMEETPLLAVWEGEDGTSTPGDWRHIGSLNYSSGGWQHIFAAVAVPRKLARGLQSTTNVV